MALFNITIEKVIIQSDNTEELKKLDTIIALLTDDADGKVKQEIMDKLNSAIEDIKSTV
jgi:hypothetical protein